TEQGVALAILRGVIDFKREPWPQISDSAKSLVRQMLEPDPKKRLTAEQVLEHPWLQNAKKASNVPLGDIVRTRLKQFSLMNRFKKRALRDGRISYEEFVAMMKTGTDWRKASRQYSRERFKSLSINLMKDGSLQLHDGISGQAVVV
ncbi:hypothetical protein TSUD_209080, partial [Trifolium subterraneum]